MELYYIAMVKFQIFAWKQSQYNSLPARAITQNII